MSDPLSNPFNSISSYTEYDLLREAKRILRCIQDHYSIDKVATFSDYLETDYDAKVRVYSIILPEDTDPDDPDTEESDELVIECRAVNGVLCVDDGLEIIEWKASQREECLRSIMEAALKGLNPVERARLQHYFKGLPDMPSTGLGYDVK